MKCKSKSKSGTNCKNNAVSQGYCRTHHPEAVAKRKEKKKLAEDQKNQFNEVLELIEDTSQAKGWHYKLDSYDYKYYRYATALISRNISKSSYTSDEVIGQFNITVDGGVKVSCTKTSFYGNGLSDLQNSIMDELDKLPWLESKNEKSKPPTEKDSIYRLINRFHLVATQIKRRYNSRDTLRVVDEYDVQDLFHSILKIYFDDVRPEEYSPSSGGAASRLDFLLKKEEIVIEVKMASSKLTDKKIGEQLIIDIERYRVHPDCKTLICFIYDPEMHLRNPTGIEKDLSRNEGELEVKVMVVPK